MTREVLLPVGRIRCPLLRRATIVLTLPLLVLVACPAFAIWNVTVALLVNAVMALAHLMACLVEMAWAPVRELLRLPGMTWRLLKSVRDTW